MALLTRTRSLCLAAAVLAGLSSTIAYAKEGTPRAAELDKRFADYLEACHSANVCNGVFLVARDGRPIYSAAIGEAGDKAHSALSLDTQFDIGSISKQFTAVAVLKLAREGKFALSDPVARHLLGFPYPDITIKQLLSHTSGMPDALDYYSALLRSGKATQPLTGADIVTVLAKHARPALFPPGTRYEYNNSGYLVLAALVEAKSGVPFPRYLEQNLFKPLGLKHTLLRTPENEALIARRAYGFRPMPNGERKPFDQLPGFYVQGAGGIYSTVGDLLKWQQALKSGKILTPAEWRLATTPARLADGSNAPYGLGMSLRLEPGQAARLGHGGHYRGFISHLAYYPKSRLTVIMLTNNSPERRLEGISGALQAIALGQVPEPARPSITAEVYRRVASLDPATTRQWFTAARTAAPAQYEFSEDELNSLGYWWLQGGDAAKARQVFELAVIAFPKSANAHDSLAEALEALGDNPAALAEAKNALALEPGSKPLQMRVQELTDKAK